MKKLLFIPGCTGITSIPVTNPYPMFCTHWFSKLDFGESKFCHLCPIWGEQAFAYVSPGHMQCACWVWTRNRFQRQWTHSGAALLLSLWVCCRQHAQADTAQSYKLWVHLTKVTFDHHSMLLMLRFLKNTNYMFWGLAVQKHRTTSRTCLLRIRLLCLRGLTCRCFINFPGHSSWQPRLS